MVDYERRTVLEPTEPILYDKVVAIYKLPNPRAAKAWVYIQPFKGHVWLSACASIVLMSFILKVFSIVSPVDKRANRRDGRNQPNKSESLFSFGAMLQQGEKLCCVTW